MPAAAWLGARMRYAFGLLVICLAVSGCVELAPIRDYADAASDLVSGKEIVNRWKNSDVELQRRTQALFDKPAPGRRDADTQKRAEAAANELYKVHDVLGEYFAAVGQLAADELPSVDKQVASLSDAIKMLDRNFGAPEQAAFQAVASLLSLPLDAYRQKQLRVLLTSQRENIDKLLSILERSTAVIASDLKAEQQAVADPFSRLLGDVDNPALRFLVRERMLEEQRSGYGELFSSISRYQSALADVRSKHESIARALNSDRVQLKQTLVNLNRARARLVAARDAIEKLGE
jgi:chromosome segregation ATPase